MTREYKDILRAMHVEPWDETRAELRAVELYAHRRGRAFRNASIAAVVMFLIAVAGWLKVWGIF